MESFIVQTIDTARRIAIIRQVTKVVPLKAGSYSGKRKSRRSRGKKVEERGGARSVDRAASFPSCDYQKRAPRVP
ncbi:hypothetical protein V1478_009302 [Vespula squamosa]|uniref:Uncharacterized protein n=1 Tax=Vespula squamosa TaxID=30214 RepID=A0ABD2APA3_VESSQ